MESFYVPKSAQNIILERIYNRYAQRAQIFMRKRNLKFFAESNSIPKNQPIYKKSAQNMMFVGIYNRYALRAQIRVRMRNLKNFCGIGFSISENPPVQKISTFYRLIFKILELT